MKKYLIFFLVIVTASLFLDRAFKESQKILAQDVNSWTEDQSADCAVVLTGGPGRVREGFDLLAQRRIKKLIISGVYPAASLRDIFPQLPFYGSIDEEDIILEKRSGSTYGNAQQTLPLVEALHCRDIILITSRIHMYRANKIFVGVFPEGFRIIPRATISGSYRPKFFPVAAEVLKSLFYSIWAY